MTELINRGRDRSPTFRDLVSQLESRDWLIFVQSGRCPDRILAGCLVHNVARFEGRLYLRLVVSTQGRHPDVVIATLAHELQHALEIVTEGTVTDNHSLESLTRRIADERYRTAKATIYETIAAKRMGEIVLSELQRYGHERTE